MKVKIITTSITALEYREFDFSIPIHFIEFINKLEELFYKKMEFKIFEIKEHELYFHDLNHSS